MNYFSVSYQRWLLLGCLLLLLILFFYFHLYSYLTFQTLVSYQKAAQNWTIYHYKLTVGIYLLTHILCIACGIPAATVFALVGGFLFGSIAILYSTFASTAGGSILFFTIRTTLGQYIARRPSGWVKKLEHGFQKDAFNYIVTLRLLPILPCLFVNVVSGMLNVRFKTFVYATVLGILPSTLIYVMLGRGVDKLFLTQREFSPYFILQPFLLFPLLGLAVLSLLPIFYKRPSLLDNPSKELPKK